MDGDLLSEAFLWYTAVSSMSLMTQVVECILGSAAWLPFLPAFAPEGLEFLAHSNDA